MVPRLHLGVGEVQLCRQLHPILNAQVLLTLEAALQGLELVIRESSPGTSEPVGDIILFRIWLNILSYMTGVTYTAKPRIISGTNESFYGSTIENYDSRV